MDTVIEQCVTLHVSAKEIKPRMKSRQVDCMGPNLFDPHPEAKIQEKSDKSSLTGGLFSGLVAEMLKSSCYGLKVVVRSCLTGFNYNSLTFDP